MRGTATAARLGSYDVAVVLTAFTLLTFWVPAPLKPAEDERDEGSGT